MRWSWLPLEKVSTEKGSADNSVYLDRAVDRKVEDLEVADGGGHVDVTNIDVETTAVVVSQQVTVEGNAVGRGHRELVEATSLFVEVGRSREGSSQSEVGLMGVAGANASFSEAGLVGELSEALLAGVEDDEAHPLALEKSAATAQTKTTYVDVLLNDGLSQLVVAAELVKVDVDTNLFTSGIVVDALEEASTILVAKFVAEDFSLPSGGSA